MSVQLENATRLATVTLAPTCTVGGIKIDMLTHSNYFSWVPRAKAILKKEKVWTHFREGEHNTKSEDYLDAKDYLNLLITDEVWQDVNHLEYPDEIWSQLESKYLAQKESKQSLYERLLLGVKMDETKEDIQGYLNRISRLVAQFRSVDGQVSNVSYTGYIIKGLPSQYSGVTIVLNTYRGDVDFVKNALLGEEIRLKELEGPPRAFAATTSGGSKSEGSKQGGKSKVKCYYCGKEGHYKRDCRKLKAKQASEEKGKNGENSKDSNKSEALMMMARHYSNLGSTTKRQWYIDSGASEHITGDREAFYTFQYITPFPVTLGDNSHVNVTGIGSIKLALGSGEEIGFSRVLYAREFGSNNLLSVAQMAKKGANIAFRGNGVFIEYNNKVVASGTFNPRVGIYNLDQQDVKILKATVPQDEDELRIQHRRYGHINNDYVQKSSHVTKGYPPPSGDLKADCDECSAGKSTRTSMYPSNSKPEVGDHLDIDMWGKSPIVSLQGNDHMLSIIERASGVKTVYFLSDRKGFFDQLEAHVKYMDTQYGKKVKQIRLDNAPEFSSERMNFWAKSQGIELQFTTIYTPEQNGVAERGMRTIFDGTRANLIDSELPPEFWQFAAEHFIHGYNRCYRPSIGKTPYEVLKGKPPDVSHLKIFGSLVFCHIPKEKAYWNKLSAKAFPGILVGYSGSGYKIWDPARQELVVSNHVEIKEARKGSALLVSEHLRTEQLRAANIDKAGDGTPQPSDNILYGDTIVVETPDDYFPRSQGLDQDNQESRGNNIQSNSQLPNEPNRDLSIRSDSPSSIEQRSPTNSQIGLVDPENQSSVGSGSENHSLSSRSVGNSEKASTAASGAKSSGPIREPTRQSQRIRGLDSDGASLAKMVVANITKSGETPTLNSEPSTIQEAFSSPDAEQWRDAVKSEMNSLIQNHTWDLIKRPNGKNFVDSKWVFKRKDDGRFKARLVARGFTQTHGVDYFETYSPVARFATIRLVLALAAKYGLRVQQMDVDTAFLYGDLEEELYMNFPPGYIRKDKDLVCKLNKSLYGLKQAPRVWYQVINQFLTSLGFKNSGADPALYIEKDAKLGQLPLLIAVYVDDLILVHKDIGKIEKIKDALKGKFNMKDLGEVKNLLGMEVERTQDGSIFIHQSRYILKLLKRFGMEGCKPIDTPMAPRLEASEEEFDQDLYSKMEGGIMWPSLITRPDIAFVAAYLARWNSNPTTAHFVAQKRVLRYLRGTVDYGILYKSGNSQGLKVYSDADWAGDIIDRKSTSGNIFTYQGGAITWASSKQKTVANSSVESEYIAIALTAKEALWLKTWFKEVGFGVKSIDINMDSNGALHLANNAQFSQRTKHIDIKHHFIRDHLEKGDISLQYLSTEENTADCLTKPLEKIKFEKFRAKSGVTSRKDAISKDSKGS